MYNIKSYIKFIIVINTILVLLSCSRINFNKKNITDNTLSLYLSAKKSYEKGDFELASARFKSIYEKYPNFYQAGFMYGKSQFFLGKTDHAGSIFKKLYSNFPAYTAAGFWHARTLYESGKLNDSEKRLKKLLSFQPDNPEMLYMLALISLEQNRIPDALSFLKKASLFGERLAPVYFQLGKLYEQFGLRDKSLEELSRAEALLAKEAELYNSVKTIKEKISKGSR